MPSLRVRDKGPLLDAFCRSVLLQLCLHETLNIVDKSCQIGLVPVHVELADGDEAHRERTRQVLLRTVQNETPAPRKLPLDARCRFECQRGRGANLGEGSVNFL